MDTLSKKVNALPQTPGVYLFSDTSGTIIYVGKAINLRRRVKQYFDHNHTQSPKTQQLVEHITNVRTIQALSEFDALLLESKLIKSYQPKYNIIAKDDTSPIYIHITFEEELPHIYLTRKSRIGQDNKKNSWFGPFQSTRVASSILRSIRRIIPYCTQKQRTGKPCFYTHIGLCDPCPSLIDRLPPSKERTLLVKEYQHHCRQIRDILAGKSKTVQQTVKRSMDLHAKNQLFEQAARERNQLKHLNDLFGAHFDPSMYLSDDHSIGETLETEVTTLIAILAPYYPTCTAIHKIECIDISNTAGTNPVGSLVVLSEGRPDKSSYRRFSITDIKGPNDFAMIAEVVKRRFAHMEWRYPDLLVIDGGSGQVKAAKKVCDAQDIHVPIIGLAKRFETIIIPTGKTVQAIHLPTTSPAIHLIQRIRDESHRFAITYHRLLRKKAFLPTEFVDS